jgi:hypothetical protein
VARSVFTSFHYQRDASRVQQVLNMGAIEGQSIMSAQDWESVKRQGAAAIQNWIDTQMKYKAAVVVLVGKETASRPWVIYEIEKAWTDNRPLVGIRINGLKDLTGNTDTAGASPFGKVKLTDGLTLDSYIPLWTPSGSDSKAVYASISANLENWVASAVKRA